MLDVLEFYKETREQSQDGVWEKFGNAYPPRLSVDNGQRINVNVTPPPLPQRTRPKLVVVPSNDQPSQQQQPPSIPARPPGFGNTTSSAPSPPIIPSRPSQKQGKKNDARLYF